MPFWSWMEKECTFFYKLMPFWSWMEKECITQNEKDFIVYAACNGTESCFMREEQ